MSLTIHIHQRTMNPQEFIIVPSDQKAVVSREKIPPDLIADNESIEIFEGVKAYFPTSGLEDVHTATIVADVTFSKYVGERGDWHIPVYERVTIRAPWVCVIPDPGATFTLSMLLCIISFDSQKTPQESLNLRGGLPSTPLTAVSHCTLM